jgi:release factor glutamine methyltransferase
MDAIDQYYIQNEKRLIVDYPGISLEILKNEFNTFQQKSNKKISFRTNLRFFIAQTDQGIPLSYITGFKYFYKSEFIVNSKVLIPRSETEILVEYGVEFLKNKLEKEERLDVIDIGSGSGAIILSLLKEMDKPINAYASDIDSEALEIVSKNLFFHRYSIHPQTSLKLIEMDRLSDTNLSFDLILSNPPYIKSCSDLSLVHEQVDKHEPKLALYIEDEKYENWFGGFLEQIGNKLNQDGMFIMEGHENHLASILNMAKKYSFKGLKIIKDYTGRDRFLIGHKE